MSWVTIPVITFDLFFICSAHRNTGPSVISYFLFRGCRQTTLLHECVTKAQAQLTTCQKSYCYRMFHRESYLTPHDLKYQLLPNIIITLSSYSNPDRLVLFSHPPLKTSSVVFMIGPLLFIIFLIWTRSFHHLFNLGPFISSSF